jgi:S1-C subfamily serine protease
MAPRREHATSVPLASGRRSTTRLRERRRRHRDRQPPRGAVRPAPGLAARVAQRTSAYAGPVNLEQTIDHVRGFVVQITYTIVGLERPRLEALQARGAVWSIPLGTGFIISRDGVVATAQHVIDGVADIRRKVPEGNHIVGVGFAYPAREHNDAAVVGSFRVVKFDHLATDQRNDIALLRLRKNLFDLPPEDLRDSTGDQLRLAVAHLHAARPADGTAIAVSGFPLSEAAMVTTAGGIASAWSTDVEGALVPDGSGGYQPTDRVDRYLGDVQSNPGNSGGPTYRIEDGAVIGMLTGSRLRPVVGHDTIQTSANLAQIIPIRFVVALAEANGVNISYASSEGSSRL